MINTMNETQAQLLACFATLRLDIAGRFADPLRWSASDLATDLAPLLDAAKDAPSSEIVAPILHLNGDRAETLVAQLEQAHDACHVALKALRECAGNARNFYPDPGRWERYCAQHAERQRHIQAVMQSLNAEYAAIIA